MSYMFSRSGSIVRYSASDFNSDGTLSDSAIERLYDSVSSGVSDAAQVVIRRRIRPSFGAFAGLPLGLIVATIVACLVLLAKAGGASPVRHGVTFLASHEDYAAAIDSQRCDLYENECSERPLANGKPGEIVRVCAKVQLVCH